MSRLVLLLFLLFVWGFQPSSARASESPQVVVSIKPIHALVSGVMDGVAEPQLLVKGGGSPHGYVLRPSEAKALAAADLIVWVGPQLESFLARPLATLGRHASQLQLISELEERLLPAREGGSWDNHEADSHHHHDEHEYNPHVWLDPLLAQSIVEHTAAALIRLDPDRGSVYAANSERVRARLQDLHLQLQQTLAPVSQVPYVVFHDAYPYFEARYGLNAVGSISVDPERRPGVRRILEIREKLNALQARCVFSEPQFEPRLVATIIEGTGARTGILDPLGIDLEPGFDSYFQLLQRLADNLVAGLR